MLTDYIGAALRHAEMQQLPDGRWYGRIPPLGDVWAFAATIDDCEAALRHAVEDWLIYRATAQMPIPPIDGICPD